MRSTTIVPDLIKSLSQLWFLNIINHCLANTVNGWLTDTPDALENDVGTNTSKNVETTKNQESKRCWSRCSKSNNKYALYRQLILSATINTNDTISVGFILVFTCSFGPLEAFHIMRAIGWDVIPIRKFSRIQWGIFH